MKKIIIPLLLLIFTIGLTYKVNSQERKALERGAQFQGERKEGIMGEAVEIRRKMREIEIQTIQNDPELKKMQEQINSLQKQLEEKLQQKLSTNQEYQELKKKRDEMVKQWEERRREKKEEKSQ
ncbi:MAG: hypothetical protein ACPLZ9_01345 [Candidatus Ratteibacteria bacterium]